MTTNVEITNEAVERVERNADERWKFAALTAVIYLSHRRAEFTTDDVAEFLSHTDVTTHEPRAMGAVMRRAARQGFIVATDRYRPSTRPQAHQNPKRVWRSLVIEAAS
jgi:hypothetical protein